MGQQAAVIHVALAALHHGIEEVVQKLGNGQIEAKTLGGAEGVAEIFQLKLGRTAWLEGAINHPLSVFG